MTTAEDEIRKILSEVRLPRLMLVKQTFDKSEIPPEEIPARISGILGRFVSEGTVRPGMRIAVTAGSREIQNIVLILSSVIKEIKGAGALPFIVPAMGSHGGATAEGQKELLRAYGITEESMKCPVISSMETALVGKTEDGRQVFMDKNAYEADGILIVGRVKPHTDFRGDYESGIMKMMAIGLGKQRGAASCHSEGFGKMAENVKKFGHVIRTESRVIGAVAILENAYDRTMDLVGLNSESIEKTEPELLKRAKAAMPKIKFGSCDVLVIDEIGKNYSGTGMDPNVCGRHATRYSEGGIASQRVVVLGVSEKSHRNGLGIGNADITTRRTAEKLDLNAMYVNALTSGILNTCRIPCAFESDLLAIKAAIKTCINIGEDGIRLIRIPNTLRLEYIMVSENYINDIKERSDLEVIGKPFNPEFDVDGFIV